MFVAKTDAQNLLKGFIDTLGGKLKETNEFLASLADEDDWSFVIKSHALIEATVTNLITSALGDDRIYLTIERLPLSESQAGKIIFAKQLGVLEKPQIRFIKWYSELRNQLVHKVDNIEFNFLQYWASLDANQKKSWKDTIDWARESTEPSQDFCDLIEKQPKTALWLSILTLIGICEVNASQAILLRKINNTSEETTKKHIKRQEELIVLQSQLIKEQAALLEQGISGNGSSR